MSVSIPIIDGIFKIIDKVIPDPQAKQAAQFETLKLAQAGEFKQIEADVAVALGQLEVNKAEAISPNVFVSGWRPAVGWVCVIGLLYNYLLRPLLAWGSAFWTVPAPPPIEMGDLIVLLAGMLGFGGMRMVERLKGKS